MTQKRNIPKEGQIYRHFKGSLYKVLTVAVHTETSDKLVVYQSLEKPERVFARPLDMFLSDVDHIRYPLVRAKYRFTLLVEETQIENDEEVEETAVEIEQEAAKAVETNIVEAQTEDTAETSQTEGIVEKAQPEGAKEENAKPEEINEEKAVEKEESSATSSESIFENDSDDTVKYKVDGELVLDPIVEAILDEKEFSKKIEYFELLRGKCTKEMLTTLAISLDIQLSEESVEENYAQILKTLRMHNKYESARLRP